MGLGLVVGLLRGCQSAGVTLVFGCRVDDVRRDTTGVTGVVVRSGDETSEITARRGVVIASGGFEWDTDLVAAFPTGARLLLCARLRGSSPGFGLTCGGRSAYRARPLLETR